MAVSRKVLCIVYGLIALLALVGTWGNNLDYLGAGVPFSEFGVFFWKETLANPASRSITVDLFFLALAALVWMVLEARRLSMRWVWLYLVFGMLIAISVTVPLFLLMRERALAAREPGAPGGTFTNGDVVGLVLVTAATLAYTAVTFLAAP